MEPIFNFRAQAVGWLNDEIAFSGDGSPTAFISEGAVFAASGGRYPSQLDDGVFRDRLGCIAAFVRGSMPCSVLTMPQDEQLALTIQSRVVSDHAPQARRTAQNLCATNPVWTGSALFFYFRV